MNLRSRVILSIFKRNFSSYFAGVLGYVFIIAFVVVGGWLAFNGQFFTANEPNLDQLSLYYPQLLLFLVPAITMGIWADERRSGTDELLFTLPATDLEILLGKYLAVLAVYSVTLVFLMSHVFVLMVLGNPDWGLLIATYFGYWLAGAALLSAGMVASILTSSTAVAFVLGVMICIPPVFIGELGSQVGSLIGVPDLFANLSVLEQFRDFGMGIVSLSSVLYFVLFTVFMLFLNGVLMKRRHWLSTKRADMGLQYTIRTIALGVMLTCATALAGYAAFRVDATSEKLFSLSPETRGILNGLESERAIQIQAFLSPDVPREYVDTRKRLVGLLRQFDAMGGEELQVRYVDVEPFSEEADEAEHFGITPMQVLTERDGRRSQAEVYLGAVVISSYDKVTVPFFGKGLPIEYELTRSIQTVATEKRHTVGVLQTDANVLRDSQEWQIVTELKKQYDVEEVSPASAIDPDRFDVLIAILPSSLTDSEMDNLVQYVQSGEPVLIFDDPFPLAFTSQFGGINNAPKQPKPRPGGGMMGGMFGGGNQQPPVPKADEGRATRLIRALGVRWDYDRVTFDLNNPHPEIEDVPAEYVFVTRDNEVAFPKENPVSRGLQEVLAIYAGTVSKDSMSDVEFEPLITTSTKSGVLGWNEFVDEGGFNFMSMQPTVLPRRNPFRTMDPNTHAIAAQLKSTKEGSKVNAIYVADIDMISDFFFQQRSMQNIENIEFDNVTFVLNAVDALAGDLSYVDLRSRRAEHRTLKLVEAQKRVFLEEANVEEKKAEDASSEQLEERRAELTKRLKEIEGNENLDPVAKVQMIRAAQDAEQKRLSLAEAQIEQAKENEVRKIRAVKNRKVRATEARFQALAVLLPPLPAVFLGVAVYLMRQSAERRTVTATRRRDH